MSEDPPAQGTQESTATQLQALTTGLPGLMSVINSQLSPTAQAAQNASNLTDPQAAALQAKILAKYGPSATATGSALANQAGLANTATNAAIQAGPGQQLLDTLQGQQQKLDPEYYATRAAAGSQVNNLLGSIDLSGLSGSERSEVERSNNQQDASRGLLNTPSQTATVNNAMNFGSALQAKRNALSQALGTATSFLSGAQGPINAQSAVAGQPNQGNIGLSQFGSSANSGQTAASNVSGTSNSLLGAINSTDTNNANINANRRSSLDMVNSTLSSLPT